MPYDHECNLQRCMFAFPLLQNNGSQSCLFNNLPVIDFSADNSRFLQSSPAVQNGITLAVICNSGTQNTTNEILSLSTNSNSICAYGTLATGIFVRSTTVGVTANGTTGNVNPKILIFTQTNLIYNGASEYSGSTQLAQVLPYFTNIGGRQTSSAHRGLIAEIIAYDSSFTLTKAQELSANINSEYAIY